MSREPVKFREKCYPLATINNSGYCIYIQNCSFNNNTPLLSTWDYIAKAQERRRDLIFKPLERVNKSVICVGQKLRNTIASGQKNFKMHPKLDNWFEK